MSRLTAPELEDVPPPFSPRPRMICRDIGSLPRSIRRGPLVYENGELGAIGVGHHASFHFH